VIFLFGGRSRRRMRMSSTVFHPVSLGFGRDLSRRTAIIVGLRGRGVRHCRRDGRAGSTDDIMVDWEL